MNQYVIFINQLQGVELILKALRFTSCTASHQLADGIEKNLCVADEKGIHRLELLPAETPAKPALKVMQ